MIHTTPPKPNTKPRIFDRVSGSRKSHGATSASVSGFVDATIAPTPDAKWRSAIYVQPR
jgi:hypothetical protein